MDVYLAKPVNKTASLVTNQSGCSDDFLNNTEEQRKILGRKKANISRAINELKKEMGVRQAVYNGKLPRFVLRHPRYKELLRLINEVNEIEKELSELKRELVHRGQEYEKFFFTIFKELFPEQYQIVKNKAIEKTREAENGNT